MSILAITEQLLEPLDAELASAEVLLARAADPTATRPTTSELLQALEVQLVQFEELAEFRELLELRARAVISTIRRLLALQPSN
ncbi:MAG: hypothetical protein NT062_12385 [Proteobacteria bacterium]|nr:hypothetical protein [Pseudomonadota bacterium]